MRVADQLDTSVDLGRLIKPGENTIKVVVASTMLNRLRVTRPSEFGSYSPTVNGLVGPVSIKPYRTVTTTIRN